MSGFLVRPEDHHHQIQHYPDYHASDCALSVLACYLIPACVCIYAAAIAARIDCSESWIFSRINQPVREGKNTWGNDTKCTFFRVFTGKKLQKVAALSNIEGVKRCCLKKQQKKSPLSFRVSLNRWFCFYISNLLNLWVDG